MVYFTPAIPAAVGSVSIVFPVGDPALASTLITVLVARMV
jgi:hypothetical protein